jgi:hypothetical protein
MRVRGRVIGIVAALAVSAVGAHESTAGAKAAPNSFEGACSFQGTVRFSPPATNQQQSLTVVYDANGTCSGLLNGKTVSNAPVTAHNAARNVNGSCMRADTTEPTSGWIRFGNGTTIRFASEFHFVGTNGSFTVHGQRSGSAHGTGSFLTMRTPPDLALQCAGSGAPTAPLDISLVTDSPLVSGSAGAKNRSGGQRRHRRRAHGATTFDGNCEFSGQVRFTPPLQNAPRPVRQRIRAPGKCSGTLVDRRGRRRRLSNATTTYAEASHADGASCGGGTATGHGSLRFRRRVIRFAFSETRAGGAALGTARGAKSGSASGVGTVSQSESPATIAAECAGAGMARVKVDIRLTTTPRLTG